MALLVATLQSLFPDSEAMTKHLLELLSSSRRSDEIQGEVSCGPYSFTFFFFQLIDLLGFEQFELVGQILEARNSLNQEIVQTKDNVKKAMKDTVG